MLEKPPRLWVAIALSLFGMLIWVLGGQIDSQVGRLVLLVIMIGFGGGGLFAGLDWAVYRIMQHARVAREVAAITPEYRMLQVLAGMTPQALSLVLALMPQVELIPGPHGPSVTLFLTGVEIPIEFVFTFLKRGSEAFLCPIRMWPEGSREREWAITLTNYFIFHGFAEEARGNRPARWMNQQAGLVSIGMETQDGEEMITKEFLEHLQERRRD